MEYNRRGFTIVELMIAISVFTTAMVLVLAGVIHISRQYQQASNRSALEESSRLVHQQIGQSIKFSNIAVQEFSNSDYKAVCFGNDKYIYGNLSASPPETAYNLLNEGLFLTKNNDNCGSADPTSQNARNLLPAGAKVIQFDYDSNTGTLTTNFVKVPADGGDLLKFEDEISCDSSKFGREYCASVTYTSTAKGRIH